MTYRKRNSRTAQSKFSASDYVPVWNQQHTNATNLMAEMAFDRLGVTDWQSYFTKLAIPIALCFGVGCIYGALHWGVQGAVLCAIAGIAAPAASVYLLMVLAYAAVLLLLFVLAWTVIVGLIFLVLSN